VAVSNRQRLFSLALIFAFMGLTATPLGAQTFFAQERQQASLAVMRTVLGILSFVRFPKPTEPLILCVAGEVRFASALTSELRQNNGQSIRVQRYQDSDALPVDCNVLYLGKLPIASQQALFERFSGKPALLISEADEECAVGHMFCLIVNERQVNFIVNLDSLARSTVRVHPNVLKLARGRR